MEEEEGVLSFKESLSMAGVSWVHSSWGEEETVQLPVVFEETACIYKMKIVQVNKKSYGKREYRNGIKNKETRLGSGETHNVCRACIWGFKANMCT